MKKFFTLLTMLMLMASVSFAQQNYYFWKKSGKVLKLPISQVDSVTLHVGSWLFQISKPMSTDISTNYFDGTTRVALIDRVKSLSITPEIGICYSCLNNVPTYNDKKEVLGGKMQEYSFTLTKLYPGTTYYYRTYVKLVDEVFYSEVNSIATYGEKPQNVVINGHNFVDLGLSSGLLWAETNVGAKSASDDGEYFAWGETEPKSIYSWDTYKWGKNSTKYNSSDGKTILDSEDDVASVKWGTPCRMPSSFDFKEIESECECSWQESYNGTSGYLITGPNGNTIFFPASGFYYKSLLDYNGLMGFYWSNRFDSTNSNNASYILNFSSSNFSPISFNSRDFGLPVRPVAER